MRTKQEQLLSLLISQAPLFRAELARKAGVSRATVSTIVSELMARGLVVETDKQPGEDLDGRAGNRLSINPRAAVVAGMNHAFAANPATPAAGPAWPRHHRITGMQGRHPVGGGCRASPGNPSYSLLAGC